MGSVQQQRCQACVRAVGAVRQRRSNFSLVAILEDLQANWRGLGLPILVGRMKTL